MDINRRDFLKNSVLAGIGTTIATSTSEAATFAEFGSTESVAKKKIIVAGAGITGLCCAYELMKSGHDVTVLEASGRHGGHVYTGRDGLTDGFYTDYGADHITKPGYERFFEYAKIFKLPVLPYPHAEGSDAAPGRNGMRMIKGKFYTDSQLSDPEILKQFGFNENEIKLLASKPWYALGPMYLRPYLGKIKDPDNPFVPELEGFDKIPVADLYKKEGASQAALDYLGGKRTSALFTIWRYDVMALRGIPLSHGDTFHLKGGNQELPNAFAKRLGARVKLSHEILAIERTDAAVTVKYKSHGFDDEHSLTADLLVNCIPLTVFRNIPVTPSLSEAKQYVVNNLSYSSHPFYTFEASSRFWLDDGFKSINMDFEHPDISSIWEENYDPASGRVILKAYAPGGVSAQRGLAAFREVYPGKKDTIVQALTYDWTTDKFAPTCEMQAYPLGEMHRFWPEISKPDGRIYFAGTYADNLSRGMESCLRSAQRVAKEINQLK
jgi:monoamine oxidase